MAEQYTLPEYDLKVNALEMGFLVASIKEDNMKRMEEEMPDLYNKIWNLVESFYHK